MMQTIRQIEPSNGHVVIISIPRLGHIIPMLDFAKHLSLYCHVTFIVSISILDKIKNNNTNQLEFIGLLDNINNENKISDSKLDDDINRMNEPLRQLLSTMLITSSSSFIRPVHMIISDIFNPLPIRIAHEHHIFTKIFMPCNFENLFRYIKISIGELIVPMSQQFVQNFLEVFTIADGIICNSIAHFEQNALDRYHQQSIINSNLPVRFIGPLFSEKDEIDKNDIIVHVKEWLDMQWDKANQFPTVIYVAFGSIVNLTGEQIVEISRSISSYPSIWSLKNDYHKYLSSSSNLVFDWMPQRFILSHPAVKLFISHGGWNSILESMSAGKPMLILPMFGDQFLNGERVENEFGIGRVIRNTKSNGHQRLILADEINQYLQQLFDPNMSFSKKAQELQTIVRHAQEHTSKKYLNEIKIICQSRMILNNFKLIK
ncbi:hypothetical protein I4U23_021893 [Adineta vaga]|nr:hypothetical protein I4U23_021893 [Adineta vaga]